MRRRTTIMMILVIISSCKHGELTLEDLQNAKWDSVAPGVYYISKEVEKGIASTSDSLKLLLEGVSNKEIISADMSFNKISGGLDNMFSGILKLRLPDSKAGYLCVNLNEMMRDFPIKVIIYLKDNNNTLGLNSVNSDSAFLKNISGIKDVNYVSKEAAKEKYIADGNDDWSDILDANPLPASIELNLDNREWTEKDINDLKNLILDKVHVVADISYPSYLLKENDEFYFFQYRRLKKQ